VAKYVAAAYVPDEGNVDAPSSQPSLFIGMHRLQAGNCLINFMKFMAKLQKIIQAKI
jgi:hypothetical protein